MRSPATGIGSCKTEFHLPFRESMWLISAVFHNKEGQLWPNKKVPGEQLYRTQKQICKFFTYAIAYNDKTKVSNNGGSYITEMCSQIGD